MKKSRKRKNVDFSQYADRGFLKGTIYYEYEEMDLDAIGLTSDT